MRVSLDIAAAIGQVDKATIAKWVQRGHIGRYDGEYETMEILLWIEQRDTNKAVAGAVAANANYRRRRRAA